ncbi:DEAD/DEAH box helicase family protein [Skermania sp. ID1734]|uniref:DEAD/DEAH box helicase family protein n=1 Tax=Skermania sp. ID1734 TaxID=2597516 RepID=UPI001C8F2E90|nr:DEAD/DEAH box helicase family protein [Skermania sp. ID1734]
MWIPAPNVVAGLEPDPEEVPTDTCSACGAHVAEPHAPDCPQAVDEVDNHAPTAYVPPRDYSPDGTVTVPSGEKARVRANLAALQVLSTLDDENRYATSIEQEVLAAWSGWGGCPTVFDVQRDEWAPERDAVRAVLNDAEYDAAKRSTLNAHYTDPAIARVMWDALVEAGFQGGRVLEPGCGSGNFVGLAPDSATMVGVELDPTSARIAHYLYPSAQIRNEGFERTRVGDGSFVAAIGNVPFGDFSRVDPVHNPGGHNIHNHFILKSLHLTAPGGYVAVISSSYTLDAADTAARLEMHDAAELVGAFRLPSRAFQRVAATQVVTDVLVFRRRQESETIPHPSTVDWIHTQQVPAPDRNGEETTLKLNSYFANHPDHVLGDIVADHGLYRDAVLTVRSSDLAAVPDSLRQTLIPVVAAARDRGAGLVARHRDRAQLDGHSGLATARELYAGTEPIGRVTFDDATDTFYRRGLDGEPEAMKVFRSRVTETKHLLRLRDLAEAAIASQRGGASPADRDSIRRDLNKVYDSYIAHYGPVNRVKLTGGKERSQADGQRRFEELEAKWRYTERDQETGRPYDGQLPDDVHDELAESAWTASPIVRRQTHLEAVRSDPAMAMVLALEHWDDETATATKSAIFSRDVVVSPRLIASAQSPDEAVAISVGERGEVQLDRIAELLNTTPGEAREQIRGLVFPDPDHPQHQLLPRSTMLSGHVLSKADRAAEMIAAEPANPDWQELHAALLEVVPTQKTPSQIGEVSPGATWVTDDDYAQFARETFGVAEVKIERSTAAAGWIVNAGQAGRFGTLCRTEYGFDLRGKSRDAIELYETLLNQRPLVVRNTPKEREDGAPEIDTQATAMAQVQGRKIVGEFQSWLWRDDERRTRLLAEWNRRFNAWVAPTHDGKYLQLPGLSPAFSPHPYQRDAVARIAAEPTVLLDHVVGAGKTGTMFMAAMELKRRGLVNQPWLVVPTHLIEQFGREVKQWYPAAQALVGRKGMDDADRRMFVAQTATSNWDMVIVPSSVFELINVAPERQERYIQTQLDEVEAELLASRSPGSQMSDRTVKSIERAKVKLESRLEKLTNAAKKDAGGVTFEQSGADYLFVDEAHEYKNKARLCAVESLAHTGSQKAEDLSLKLQLLREYAQEQAREQEAYLVPGQERVATFATGTPIANSLAEAWVMQQYLRPDVLDVAGVRSVTDWAASFTTTRSETVTNTTGTKLKVVTKVAAFQNPREMFALSAQYTDVVIRAQVPAQLPVHGGRQIVTTPASQSLRDFTADLEYRLDHANPRRPDLDNVLKVLSDGRNASMDPRLANLDPPDVAFSRVHAVAAKVAEVYHANAQNTYLTATGDESTITGALQLVFCDRGTPRRGRWSMYEGMRQAMVDLGVPEEQIAFIHDAHTAAKKAALQAACVSGRIAVLLGSTPKMGTGMNVQPRLVALHHVDVPWRPADLEQREGRIIRQGNQNRDIQIFTYVTEATTDTVMWAKVESKAAFIEQAKNGQLDATITSVEDIADESLTEAAAATKAAATGDERFIALVESEEKLKELRALDAAHRESRWTAQAKVGEADRMIPRLEHEIDVLTQLLERHEHWRESGKPFTVGGRSFLERPDRSAALLDTARATYAELKGLGLTKSAVIATFPGGVDVRMSRSLTDDSAQLWLDVPGEPGVSISREALYPDAHRTGGESNIASTRSGFATRIENLYDKLPSRVPRAYAEIDNWREIVDSYSAKIDEPFAAADQLAALEVSVLELRREIGDRQNTPEAIAARVAAEERMHAAGRTHGWSLLLNPTKKMVEESTFDDANEFVAATQRMHAYRARAYARDHDENRREGGKNGFSGPAGGGGYDPPHRDSSRDQDNDGGIAR